MLLPITSIIVWWLRRPETPENIERSIRFLFLVLLSDEADFANCAEGEFNCAFGGHPRTPEAQQEDGPVAAEAGAGDGAGLGDAFRVEVTHLAAEKAGGTLRRL